MSVAGPGRAADGHLGGALAAGLGDAAAVGMRRGRCCAHGHGQAQRLDDAGHGAGRSHHAAEADRRREARADLFHFRLVDFAGTILSPEAAAIRAGSEHFAAMMTDDHGAGGKDDGGHVDAGRCHDLSG